MHRELRVAFSRRAQPIWFRVIKWIIFINVTRRYHRTRGFWAWTGVALIAACAMHLVYRHKTHGWTQAWGGWDDPAFVLPPTMI